jgi:predicted acetyltransferase
VRWLRRAEIPHLIEVARSAFRSGANLERWTRYYAKNPHLPPERTLVAERDGRILGTAALLDLKMAIDGRAASVDGVAAVAVHHTGRRQGVADALMRRSVADAHGRRAPFSSLYAFRGSFYRRFGYAPVELGHVVSVQPGDLPNSSERLRVRPYLDRDRAAVERCYRAALAGSTGPLDRTASWWEHRVFVEDQDRVVYIAADGRITGYAIAKLMEAAPLGRRRLRVHELIALDARARRGLIGWLAGLGDEFEAVEITFPADSSVVPFLHTPRFRDMRVPSQWEPAGALGWGLMARVTHLERALATRRPRGVRLRFALELEDPCRVIEPAVVRLDATGAAVVRAARETRHVRADIGIFSQVLLGAVRATHARAFDLLETDEDTARKLDQAWLGPAPFVGSLNEF